MNAGRIAIVQNVVDVFLASPCAIRKGKGLLRLCNKS